MNIISPNGEKFGYGETFLNSDSFSEDTLNTSSSKAIYNGWGESDEEMIFENPISGKWSIEIRHDGGSSASTFNIDSNYLINSGKEIVVQNDIPGELKLQVGSNSGDNFIVDLSDVRSKELGITDLNLSTQVDSNDAIDIIDEAISTIVSERSKYGSYQNALEHIIKNVDNASENLQNAESRITDTDMAKQAMKLAKNDILIQASQSMLAQANNLPQGVLQLLK